MSAATEPTEAELAAAYESLRDQDWPELQDLRTSAARFARIRSRAIARAHQQRHVQQAEHSATAPAPACATSPPLPHHPPSFDNKRAAAGERADD